MNLPRDGEIVRFLVKREFGERIGVFNKSLNAFECIYIYYTSSIVEYWKPLNEIEKRLYESLFATREAETPIRVDVYAKKLNHLVKDSVKEKASQEFYKKENKQNYIVIDDIVAIKTSREIEFYDALELTNTWLNTTNDAFFEIYGFNWIPPTFLKDKANHSQVPLNLSHGNNAPYLTTLETRQRKFEAEMEEEWIKLKKFSFYNGMKNGC